MKYTAKDNFIKIGRAFRGDDNFDEPRTREEWHNLIGSVIPDADFDEWFEEARPSTFSEWFDSCLDQGRPNIGEKDSRALDPYIDDYVQEKIAEATAIPEQPFPEYLEQRADRHPVEGYSYEDLKTFAAAWAREARPQKRSGREAELKVERSIEEVDLAIGAISSLSQARAEQVLRGALDALKEASTQM